MQTVLSRLFDGPDFSLERGLGGVVCGVDEVGRGPLAGPVVAAAATLPLDQPELVEGVRDSKKLTANQRTRLYHRLRPYGAIAAATVEEIEQLNILHASMLAMQRAVAKLPNKPDHALIDGNRCPKLDCPATAVIKGDDRSLSIAAASILAKVVRDRLMARLDRTHPGYGWAQNKGYPTLQHRDSLLQLGVTRHHRRVYAPVKAALAHWAAESS